MVTTTTRTEEDRAFYQGRLALLHRVGFTLAAAFLGAIPLVRGLVGAGVQSELASPSPWFHLLATSITGALWAFLSRKRLSSRALEVVDAAGILGLALLLNVNAGLFEVRTVAVFNLVLTTGIALILRAVVVPSTQRRTMALGVLASASASGIFIASALYPGWPVRQTALEEWPLAYQAVSFALWLSVLVVVAGVASKVIYSLRGEVRAAKRLGQYVLGEKLGEGGMGVVYRATHAMLRRETALKLLQPDRVDPAALLRFEREVVETARLRHPNTVAIFDYGRTPDGVFYYAMEYVDGLTLASLVAGQGPLPPGRVIALLAQVCASLDEAHAMGLIHRDIKPANVMVVGHTAAYDLVKVLDFGLAKKVSSQPSLPDGDLMLGTPQYMAPEAIAQPDVVDARSDLYAVAAVGYFLLTGHHVFEGTVVEICAAHLHTAPTPPRERLGRAVPPDLEALLLRGLAKARADRPPTAADFRAALLACDVPPWSQEDARGWWKTHGERAHAAPPGAIEVGRAPTVSVALEHRLPGEPD
mgnify:CR=1 FL=1